MNTKTNVNEQIKSATVRLVDATGTNWGIVTVREALAKAREANLDLVEINGSTNPPVCKIIDYDKFLYAQKKAAKEQARKNRASEIVIKEIQLRPVTDVHDIEIKARHAREFLDAGNKVKVSVKFRGREMSFAENGKTVLAKFLEKVGMVKLEREPAMNGNTLTAMIAAMPPPKAVANAPV